MYTSSVPTNDKKKQARYAREHYERNRVTIKARARKFAEFARDRNANFLVDYLKKHPCVDCGESDPLVMDFDHVRGKKTAAICLLANRGCSIARISEEIQKCQVRCANCHRRITEKQQGFRRLAILCRR
jgi:hypothetical protein